MCPLYEYKCDKCEERFDEIHSINERTKPTEKPCPNCGEENCVSMVVGTTGIVFGCMASSVQNHKNTPGEFKEHLQRIKNGLGKTGRVKGID
jgi:putative FmdB family regulatory protein